MNNTSTLLVKISNAKKIGYSNLFDDTVMDILESLVVSVDEIKRDIECVKRRTINVPRDK